MSTGVEGEIVKQVGNPVGLLTVVTANSQIST